jgi:hypothetical protein
MRRTQERRSVLALTRLLGIDPSRWVRPPEGASVPASPHFVPDVLLGGDLAHQIPGKTSLPELAGPLGERALPAGTTRKPGSLSLLLRGEPMGGAVPCPPFKRGVESKDHLRPECGTKIER